MKLHNLSTLLLKTTIVNFLEKFPIKIGYIKKAIKIKKGSVLFWSD